jgi:hypothetical protein
MSATAPLHPVWGKALGLESTALTTSVARCKGPCLALCGREKGAKSLIYLAPWSLLAPCGACSGGPASIAFAYEDTQYQGRVTA